MEGAEGSASCSKHVRNQVRNKRRMKKEKEKGTFFQ